MAAVLLGCCLWQCACSTPNTTNTCQNPKVFTIARCVNARADQGRSVQRRALPLHSLLPVAGSQEKTSVDSEWREPLSKTEPNSTSKKSTFSAANKTPKQASACTQLLHSPQTRKVHLGLELLAGLRVVRTVAPQRRRRTTADN